MNTLNIHKTADTLEVVLDRHFNLRIKNVIKSRLNTKISNLKVDMSHCRFIDSEGVIFLYKWQKTGNQLELKNPPDIFFEIVDILQIDSDWNTETIITK